MSRAAPAPAVRGGADPAARDELAPRSTALRAFWRRFRRSPGGLIGAAILLVLVVAALAAPLIAPFPPNQQDYEVITRPPGGPYLMGTDDLGRDVFSRVVFGARISLSAAIASVGIALTVGVVVGLVSGYYRGWLDEIVVMRVTDALQSFPFLILALALAAVLGTGLGNAMIAIGIGMVPGFVRIVRAQVLQVRELEFVQAAVAVGASNLRIMFRHILPNIVSPVLVEASLAMAGAIIAEASLSYLGLGSQPPDPSWGSALRFAQGYLGIAPWMAIWPGLAISLAVISFNLLGDGLRDALDPRLKDV